MFKLRMVVSVPRNLVNGGKLSRSIPSKFTLVRARLYSTSNKLLARMQKLQSWCLYSMLMAKVFQLSDSMSGSEVNDCQKGSSHVQIRI